MAEVRLQTGAHIFEVLAYLCHSPLEALDQFVENAADAIVQAGESRGSIRIQLDHFPNHQNQPSLVIIEDNGAGMSVDKMQRVLQNIGDSEKLGYVLRGEKGLGILSFASIANELHLCSHNGNGGPSSCLILKRDWLRDGIGQIVTSCQQHPQVKRGTRAYLQGVLPEVASQLTRTRLRQYLGREFAADLRRDRYSLLVGDRHGYEAIEPRQFRGIPLLISPLDLGAHGRASVQVYALPVEAPESAIDVHGRGGVRLCSLTALEEFQQQPWLDQKLEGGIFCDRLHGTADKTAPLQNDVYRALATALHALEPHITDKLENFAREYRDSRLTEIANRVDTFIGRFLHYRQLGYIPEFAGTLAGQRARPADPAQPGVALYESRSQDDGHRLGRRRESIRPTYLHTNLCVPSEAYARMRTWCDQAGTVHINTLHPDFLSAERDDKRCAWFLFSIWAKQFLLSEYGASQDTLTDEMVGLFSQAGPLLNQLTFRSRNGSSLAPRRLHPLPQPA